MDATQGTPFQPSSPAPDSFPPQAPKIPIEPGRMQAIKEAFENYKNAVENDYPWSPWGLYRIRVSDQLDQTAVKALCAHIGAPETMDSFEIIDWLIEKGLIHEKSDELNTFIEHNFREMRPDEAVQPRPSDVQTKAQRRALITKAYQEYLDVDPANPENKITAYNTFINKVNEQMTAQEVKPIVFAYGAWASISDFKGLSQWLERQSDPTTQRPILNGKDPSTVKRMMDTIFPSTKM